MNMQRLVGASLAIAIALPLGSCAYLWPKRGEVRLAAAAAQDRGRVAFGFFEDRNDRFSPFATDNLVDMMRFELLARQYRLVELDYGPLMPRPESPAPAGGQGSPAAPSGNRNAPANRPGAQATDIFPQRLQSMAGELSPLRPQQPPSSRLLAGQEIAKLGGVQDFDFFVQGAVATTEQGVLLEVEQDSLVFLHVYAKNGEQLGALNFTVSRENLRNAAFLQDVVGRIADRFAEKFRR